jgi:hypothetical protein
LFKEFFQLKTIFGLKIFRKAEQFQKPNKKIPQVSRLEGFFIYLFI